MATQTIQFRSPPSQTVTLRLFVAGSDTQISSASATEATNRKGTYTAAFTDVPAAEYQYIATIGTSPIIPVASGYVKLTLTTATFQTYDAAKAVNLSEVVVDPGAIADAVWDEQYSQHTTAGTFGKLFDIWRKSNPAIDGVVTASVTPTTTTFSTNITGYPSGAFIHSVLLFVNGSTNAESNSPIIGYVSANGVITLEEPMQAAVQVGDEFVIAANSHVHPIASIAAGIWNSLLATYQAVGSFGKAVADTKADTTAILAAQVGDWSITRTFQISGGDKVSGVRMSLVGVAGKTDTTGTTGIGIIKADDGTFTLRVVVPAGYEDVADTTVTINGADSTATVTLTRTSLVPSVIQGAPSASLALRPAMDRKTPLLTLASVVDHLLLLDEINPAEPRSVDRASKAARDALSSFASYSTHGFRYYESRAKIVMPGTLAIGTITVTDGVFEVDGGVTIPDWAPLAHVRIDRSANKVYPVLLVNGQNLTVETLADGTYGNVYLEQLFFPLPRNFRRRGTLSDGVNNYPIEDMSGGAFQGLQDYYRWIGAGEFGRRFSAITMDQRNQGDLMLSVWPPFENRVELSMFFERYPESMKHHRVGNTAATLGVTGATATSSHAIFNSSHVGAAITIGTTNDQELLKSLASESLVETQRIIRYVTSATQVILDTPLDASVSNRAFYISDIVDVQPGVMTEAFKRLAEHELLRQTKGSKADQKLQEFIRNLQMTQADDARYKPSVDPYSTPVGGVQWGSVNGRPS